MGDTPNICKVCLRDEDELIATGERYYQGGDNLCDCRGSATILCHNCLRRLWATDTGRQRCPGCQTPWRNITRGRRQCVTHQEFTQAFRRMVPTIFVYLFPTLYSIFAVFMLWYTGPSMNDLFLGLYDRYCYQETIIRGYLRTFGCWDITLSIHLFVWQGYWPIIRDLAPLIEPMVAPIISSAIITRPLYVLYRLSGRRLYFPIEGIWLNLNEGPWYWRMPAQPIEIRPRLIWHLNPIEPVWLDHVESEPFIREPLDQELD